MAGGTPTTIALASNVMAASWGTNGQVVYSAWSSPLMTVDSSGGAPVPVIPLDEARGETVHQSPYVLPDGKAALFASSGHVEIVDLATKTRRVVADGGAPFYVNTGHLIFARGPAVFSAPFDLTRRETTGPPVLLQDGVRFDAGKTNLAVAPNGALAYLAGSANAVRSLTWVDRQGQWRRVTDDLRAFVHPRLSPDFTLFPLAWSWRTGVLAYSGVSGATNRNVWMLPSGGRPEPFLNTVADERAATCSPDGRWLVYAVAELGMAEQIYVRPSSGAGTRDGREFLIVRADEASAVSQLHVVINPPR